MGNDKKSYAVSFIFNDSKKTLTDKHLDQVMKKIMNRFEKDLKTNGQDTVLRAPKRNIDDRKFIKSVGSAVIKMQFNFENMSLKERDKNIINNLSEMEKSGSF